VVSSTANSISVKGSIGKRSRTVNFTIPTEVKLMRNGQQCAVKDLQKGDQISVSFGSKRGSSIRRVTEVEVGKSGSQ